MMQQTRSSNNAGGDNELLFLGGGGRSDDGVGLMRNHPPPPTSFAPASSSSSSSSSNDSAASHQERSSRTFPRTPQERQQATHTPPLPSAWAVKSLLMSPHPGFDPDEKEMPAIDRRRVDAAGTCSPSFPLVRARTVKRRDREGILGWSMD
jgi:hypothetical protein